MVYPEVIILYHDPRVGELNPPLIKNGKRTFSGSGGNNFFTFLNGKYKYIIHDWVMGGGGLLEVYKGNKLLLSEEIISKE
ncbi:MAG: hypothetical protein Q9M43_07790 [Sulfurimonas sp.]|nr:hypothetical protein [Sulfurimonas sp.]